MSKQTIMDTEGDLLEEALPILDTEFELGDPTQLPKELYGELKNYFPKLSNPVTDPEYDQLKKRLKKLRPDLFQPGGKFEGTSASQADFSAAKKIVHKPPMTSVQKADGDLQEKSDLLKKWIKECMSKCSYTNDIHKGEPIFAMSFKRDGVSVRLYYEKGKLVRAGVRPRDGINGADVLQHVRYVRGVPHILPEPIDCAIGGELEILIDDFEAVNKERAKKGEKLLANPRNATAGAMNPLGEPEVVRERRVSFIGHSLHMDNGPYKTAVQRAKYAAMKLKVPFVRVEPFDYTQLAKMETLVPDLKYEVDGIVIEVNHLDDAESLGQRGGSATGDPVGVIAWKFLEQHAQPTVKHIRWQPGRTGKQTPVAEFDGVKLAGTTVTNCTLHNVSMVRNNRIGDGAIIDVYKAGKIIPYCAKVIKPAAQLNIPSSCSACNSKLDDDGTELWCVNPQCPAKLVGTYVHYLSTFGVKGVAESVVTTMIQAGLLHTYANFYSVLPSQLETAGLSEREALLAYARIHMIDGADQIKDNKVLLGKAQKAASQKKEIDIGKLIAALGISGASKGTGRELNDHFRDFDKIRHASVTELLQVPNIGDTTAEAIHDFFQKHHLDMDALLCYVEPLKPKSGKFSNMTFVFTGGLPESKEYWMEKVANEGGKISSSVSKKTNYVVVGNDPGQKLEKAEQLVKEGKMQASQIIDRAGLMLMFGIASDDDRTF